ncbi:rhomboid family intramembrane serine protease, partial [Campylobacter upsaliensis]|nr:rhomboid family intramembrane serine protease [Campylobacter upsaliensis]
MITWALIILNGLIFILQTWF